MRNGWFKESYRHSLAAKGVKTNRNSFYRRYETAYNENLPEGTIYMSPTWTPARARGWPQAAHPFAVGATTEGDDIKKLIYNYWNESLKGQESQFNYQEAFDKLSPFLRKKLGEHGILTKQDYIDAEMDYIQRRRYNIAHPESPVPMTAAGGNFPSYFNGDDSGYQSRSEKYELVKEAKELPAFIDLSIVPEKEGIWADDFRAVRRRYLSTLGKSGVSQILAEGVVEGEIKPTISYDDLSNEENEWNKNDQIREIRSRYEDELGERPLNETELNYVWDKAYEGNREAHSGMSEFRDELLPLYKKIEQQKGKGYKNKLKNMELFDNLIHAQHVTGNLLPVDVNELRDSYNKQRAMNVKIAKRIDSYAGKKPWVGNIEKETLDNDNFRKVVHTGEHEQLVFMKLKPSEDIGDEVHPHTDQFIRVESGKGKVVFNEKESYRLNNGDATVVTAGMWHNIINTSDKKPLKLYTVYAPPHHKPGVVQKNKPLEVKE